MTQPLVSIVIPSYNQGCFLHEAVESVVNQDYQNLEIIIVNDGSTDNTLEVAHQMVQKYSDKRTIYVIDKKNGGVSSARNAGLAASKGIYVITLDGDDLIEPNYLSVGVAALEEHDCNLFSCNVQRFGLENWIWEPPIYNDYEMRYDNNITTAAIFKRELYEKSGGYKNAMWVAEDWDFWLNFSRYGVKPLKHETPFIRYRVNNVGIQAIIKVVNDDLFPVEEVLAAHEYFPQIKEVSRKRAERMKELYPDDWFLKFFFARIAESNQEYSVALDLYKDAVVLTDAKNWQILYRLMKLLEQVNQPASQLKRYIETLRPDMKRFI